ncbi:MAG: VOC family protein [Parvibaculaceae bacterium]|nr:VOC family protein [Parvibaculaceae bacterium]
MSTDITTPGVASWIQYTGPNAAAAKQFYKDVMGWTIADMPMQDGSNHSAIMVGDGPIGGFAPQEEATGAWTVYITVSDVDSATKKAKAAGAEILVEPVDTPGVGRMATIQDPQGARIALITYESMQG